MIYRLLVLFLIIFSISNANIIYDKNDLSITDLEIKLYKRLHKNNFGDELSNNEAIKEIVKIKKTINFLIKNNNKFISLLDEQIKLEFDANIFEDQIVVDFIRFQKIKNEFISEYYKNKFEINDLKKVLTSLTDFRIPISKNDCMTFDKVINLANEDQFVKKLYSYLKNNELNLEIIVDNEIYNVCMSNKLFKDIEYNIIKFIEKKTKEDFEKFIYAKIK